MKKNILFCLTFILTVLLILITNISLATEDAKWTDFSKTTLELKSTINGNSISYKLLFNNVTFEKTHNYYVYVKNSASDTNYENEDGSIIDGTFDNIDKFLERNGDIYVTVVENNGGQKETVLSAKKINRPKQNDIGKRITGSFFTKTTGDSAIIFFNEPHDVSAEDRKIKVKIGKVEDNKILDNIKNNGSSSLSELLSYAKNAKSIYNETIPSGIYKEAFLSKVSLSDNGYYFVYFEADDENGKYYPVEDVMLAQAQFMDNGKHIQLVNYTDTEFVWKNNSSNSNITNNTIKNTNNEVKDNTVANKIIPATGIDAFITLVIMFITIIGLTIYIRYRTFKDVK